MKMRVPVGAKVGVFALVMFIFWLGGLGDKGGEGAHGHAAAPVIAGGSDEERR